jgi:DNA helicase IV
MATSARAQLSEALKSYQGGTHQSKFERDATVNGILTAIKRLDVESGPLIFGRIDLACPDGQREIFHIGRMGVLDENLDPLVIDWRAPIAEPFYRATGRETMGLMLRRHIEVRNRIVLSLEDELFVAEDAGSTYPHGQSGESNGSYRAGNDDGIGDVGAPGALLTALERPRSARMRDMVATIQKEQDEIIRSPLRGTLVVQGGPGTGKTAVALHRAAYLLYTHRFPLETQGILVIGPNPVFLKYIEHVLPSLGESGVRLASPQGLVRGISPSFNDPYAIARLKGDMRMAGLLRQAIHTRERPLRQDRPIPYGSATLMLKASDTNRMIAEVRQLKGTHNAKRVILEQIVSNYLLEQYTARTRIAAENDIALKEAAKLLRENPDAISDPIMDTPAALLPEDALTGNDGLSGVIDIDDTARKMANAKIGGGVLQVPELRTALWRMWPRLTAEMLLNDLFGSNALLQAAGRKLFKPEELPLLYRERNINHTDVKWSYEDLALIDEARVLLGAYTSGFGKNSVSSSQQSVKTHSSRTARTGQSVVDAEDELAKTYGYIVVDEVQRLSPMELRMVARRSTSANMTLVGDIAQSTGANAISSWDDICTYMNLDTGVMKQVELTVSYRTPEEILKAAQPVVDSYTKHMRPLSAIRSTGISPKVCRIDGDFSSSAASAAASIINKLFQDSGGSNGLEHPDAGRSAGKEPGGGSDGGRPGGWDGEPGGTCAIIAPSVLCDTLTNSFTELQHELRWNLDIQLVSGESAIKDSALNVVPASLSSGLEFDHVILVDPAGIIEESPMGIRSLYVAMTRATRTLNLLCPGELPRVLANAIMLN